jgi:NAD(P)-dependent dehydrogenase (short-subunit alcohol dehydrogenase family)
MVLGILESIYRSSYFPRSYVPHILITSLAVVILHALSQGRKTSRDRDLHARTVILTGAFTSSLGITLLQDLAKRGARVIALSPYKADDPQITILVSLLRTSTGNEEVFAEECDLDDAGEVRKFCTRFLTGGQLPDSEKKEKGKEAAKDEPPPPPGSAPPPGQGSSTDQRLDAIVFAHEYPHVGAISPFRTRSSFEEEAKHRERGSLASFLMTTLLLPSLLVAPVDRDIRIVNVVNPFYAAASGPSFHDTYPASFSSSPSSSPSSSAASKPTPVTGGKPKKRSKPSVFLEEGIRSLRSVILTRHLQRVLDALPAPQAPSTAGTQATVVNPKMQKSNIVAVSVSPGVSRMDTVAPMTNANWGIGEGKPSIIGIIL